MFYSHRRILLSILGCLIYVGCGGNTASVPPQPPGASGPPTVLGRGTLAVFTSLGGTNRISIFPANSEKSTREFSLGALANSLAFDTRGHLYYGMNAGHDEYFVREVNVQSGERLRAIDLRPSWSFSSVATDDQNVLYVNTKSFVGGDVELFRPGDGKPYLKIKDPLTPLTILVARGSLWVGYQGALADGLARYDLRSKRQTWFHNVGYYLPTQVAINPEGTLVAAKVRRNGKPTVAVYEVKSGRWTQIHEGDTLAMASDDSGNLYIAQRTSRILLCTFRECPHSFETGLEIRGLALQDGMLYVAADNANGKPSGIYVYDSRTTSLVRSIPMGKALPSRIAIEP